MKQEQVDRVQLMGNRRMVSHTRRNETDGGYELDTIKRITKREILIIHIETIEYSRGYFKDRRYN